MKYVAIAAWAEAATSLMRSAGARIMMRRAGAPRARTQVRAPTLAKFLLRRPADWHRRMVERRPSRKQPVVSSIRLASLPLRNCDINLRIG